MGLVSAGQGAPSFVAVNICTLLGVALLCHAWFRLRELEADTPAPALPPARIHLALRRPGPAGRRSTRSR
jgi:hypothetical protein